MDGHRETVRVAWDRRWRREVGVEVGQLCEGEKKGGSIFRLLLEEKRIETGKRTFLNVTTSHAG